LQIPRDQNGVNVFEVDGAAVFNEENMIFKYRYLPRQKNVVASNFMPAWLEDGICKNDLGGAQVLNRDSRSSELKDLGDVERAGWVIADGNELVSGEGLAVRFVEAFGGGIVFMPAALASNANASERNSGAASECSVLGAPKVKTIRSRNGCIQVCASRFSNGITTT
jgi:hypothetical protein